MLNKEAINREIMAISLIVNEIDLALTIENVDGPTRMGLTSARGQLKAARSWLSKIYLTHWGNPISKEQLKKLEDPSSGTDIS